MIEVKVYNQEGREVGTRALDERVFGVPVDPGFVHRVYTALAEAQRRGTASTKTRGEVSGGGRKPWRQKGTGRARQGSIRAPHWRHGGVAHGPKPRVYATRVNKKERRRAMAMVLSDALASGKLTLLDAIQLDEIKTKRFVAIMKALDAESGLFVLGHPDEAVMLSARNVPTAKVVLDGQLNLHDAMKYPRLFLTLEAVDKIEERLK
ncbi:MAG: 50S ribosomal protein L4 [Zetaproteobacteria bacterium]|nr:MAG: 50S ribosomal protein L4 [Zetaproteobacteria bacterium]